MKIILVSGDTHVLRFDRGEELHAALTEYCKSHKISAGTFTAIGAAEFVRLSWFDPELRKYEDKELSGAWEVVSLTGLVAMKEGDTHLHMHGCFSDASMEARAGHVSELRVRPTLELCLRTVSGTLKRRKDGETGLYLLDVD